MACGLGDYLFWNFYFWRKDKESGKFWEKQDGVFVDTSDRERRQAFQELIYRLGLA